MMNKIDVTKCKFWKNGHCKIHKSGLCHPGSNCYFRQLQSRNEENKKLKSKLAKMCGVGGNYCECFCKEANHNLYSENKKLQAQNQTMHEALGKIKGDRKTLPYDTCTGYCDWKNENPTLDCAACIATKALEECEK